MQRKFGRQILILFFGLRIVVCAQEIGPAVAAHFKAGQQAAAAQQFDRAISEFSAVLKLDPTLVQARANLGLMYYSSGNYLEARSEFQKVTQAAPQLLPGQLFLGLSYLNTGSPGQAIPPLRKALQIDPNNAEGRRALLLCYLEQDNYEDATAQINYLQQQPLDEENLYTIAKSYLNMGESLTSRMAKQYHSSAWAHRLAGDLAADRGDWLAAIDSYRQALTLDPKLPEVHAALASALRSGGRADEAEREARASLPPLIPPMACDDGHLEICEARLRTAPDAEVVYRLIRADTSFGNIHFEKLQAAFPDSARAHEVLGEVDRLRQDFPAALAEFELAIQKRPDDPEFHRYAGEMMILVDRVSDADVELRRSAELSPGNAETEYLLAQVALKRKDADAAVIHLRKALQRNPNLVEVHALLGTSYMHLNKPALAIPELEKAQSIDYHGDLNFQLFKAYKATSNSPAAAKALARSKQLRKESLHSAVSKISGENALAIEDSEQADHPR